MRRAGRTVFLALAAFALAAVAAAVSTAAGDGWSETSVVSGQSPPERKAVYADNGISAEFSMPPGAGVAYERSGKWPSSSSASIRMYTDNVNVTGNGYVPSEAFFPVSVTFAFGEDSLTLGWKERVSLFFQYLWRGFPPSGIRLTYAWGNRVPQGSMYRLRDEEIAVVATDEAIIAGNGDTDNKAIVSQSFPVEISIIAVILQSLQDFPSFKYHIFR